MAQTAEILEGLLRKILSEQSNVPLMKFRDEYVESIKDNHSPSYVRSIEYSFQKFIDFADNVSLNKIDSRAVEKFINHIFKKSKYSASLHYRTLKAAFQKAVLWNYIPSNPFLKVKLPKIQKSKPAFITQERLEKILVKAPEAMRDIYRFTFFTGLRLSEITNLKFQNINIKERLIQIGDDEFTTKSKSIRIIPICPEAAQILHNRFPKIIKSKKHFVFCKSNNFQFTSDYISKTFKQAVKDAGEDNSIHFHSLRHSFASHLVKSGVPLYHLKELLGHSSISVTEIYSHLNIDSLKTAVDNKFNITVANQ